ncbi:ankyrin repeat domain-containing protein [Paraburkholderia phosphatilytica]|uniref:ankyrin repeat domain-containing protein n=1 Tax=Paraburkholderia phosphatilytica TaxID=2282883 RepID=UPI000F5DA8F2|nr:ankyrin repeat domain-containing protein [Paraburkholderia phosphatilytica]
MASPARNASSWLQNLRSPARAAATPATPSQPRAFLPSAGATSSGAPSADVSVKEALKAIDKGAATRLDKLLAAQPQLLTQHTAAGHTLLTHAVAAGSHDAVNIILRAAESAEAAARHAGTDLNITLSGVVNLPDLKGRTALAHAALQGEANIARQLLELHHETAPGHRVPLADINRPDLKGMTPLNHAVARVRGRPRGNGKDVALAMLARQDLLPDETPPGQKTPMQTAIERGTPEVVSAIARHANADPDMPDASGRTPVWQVMKHWEKSENYYGRDMPWETMLPDLMANPRVNPQACNAQGHTPLTHIAQFTPPLFPMTHVTLMKKHVTWMENTVRGILEATRGRANFDLRTPDGNHETVLHIMSRITQASHFYAPLYRMLADAVHRQAIAAARESPAAIRAQNAETRRKIDGVITELLEERAELGTSEAATPEQAARALSYLARIDQARVAAMDHNPTVAKAIVGEVQDAIDEDIDLGGDEDNETPTALVGADYTSISRQLGQIHKLAELVGSLRDEPAA